MASSAQPKSSNLETKLSDIFEKKAPQIPANGKKTIVEWAPWIALVVGIFTLLSGWALWHWAHAANNVLDYVNNLCNAYAAYNNTGCNSVGSSRLSFWVWIGIAVLIVEGVLYLLAFPGLRDRRRQGWKYLYYGAIVNVVYAIVSLFTSYDVAGHFIGALVGSVIGFWILFQIRSLYTGATIAKPHDPTTPPATA